MPKPELAVETAEGGFSGYDRAGLVEKILTMSEELLSIASEFQASGLAAKLEWDAYNCLTDAAVYTRSSAHWVKQWMNAQEKESKQK
ncbi:hypothetical protein UFOVP1246_29 [uncultured Caudovirales phage]|uniref:Uncharacterized protein n=1 Tax=uncultured Caudovirales phage TaxID=2100421 RepID=A0A6J5R7Y9_9CAUD|nr:hypothetical protein UFOVP1246_29 [uncultured Caudovirales phage]